MTINEIYSIEENNIDTINIFGEGMFWKVYEYSAFLFFKNIKAYHINTRFYKTISKQIIYLGFPNKVLHNIIPEQYTILTIKESKYIVIKGFEQINKDSFTEWKNRFLFEQDKNSNEITDLSKIIATFPVLNKSPLECQSFIIELQKKINEHL